MCGTKDHSAFDHRWHIIALVSGLSSEDRARCWLMMLQAYVDDSGSSPDDAYFVLGGLVATTHRWVEFSDQWKSALSGSDQFPHLDYFKASEANAMEGQFRSGWTLPMIDQKVDQLADIATKYAQYSVNSVMRWSDYNTYLSD